MANLFPTNFAYFTSKYQPRWHRGSGLDCGSEDPGSIPGIPPPRVGTLMAKEVKDVFGRPGVRVGVGSAR